MRKKLTILFALLCASVMSWATNYDNSEVATSQETITVTICKLNNTQTSFTFTGSKIANRKVFQNAALQQNGKGTLSAGSFMESTSLSFTEGTLTAITTWTTYPSEEIQVYFSLYRDNSGGGNDIMTFTLNNINANYKCGSDTRANSDLTLTSSDAVVLDVAATSTITHTTSSTGAISYTSSNPSVATVNTSGVITAVRYGEATITVSQEADASYKAGSFTVNVTVNMAKKAAVKNYGSLQLLNADLYNRVEGGVAGEDACGKVDLYVLTWGNRLIYKAIIKEDKAFTDGNTGWRCQLRTCKPDMSNVEEQWAITSPNADNKTRILLPSQETKAPGLSKYGDDFKIYSYMTITCSPDERTIQTVSYTRNNVHNYDSSDETAPVLGAATITPGVDDITISFDAVTSEEVFYLIEDTEHGQQFLSMEPSFVLPHDGSGITYNFSCYAIDYSGNVSAAQSAEVTMPFVASTNLALNKTVVAGYTPANPDEIPVKANDGNDNTAWVTYGSSNEANEWWYVDLNAAYNITNISALWGDVYSTDYILQARVLAPEEADKADDEAWTTITEVKDATAYSEKSTDVTAVGRYVRIHSLSHTGGFFRLREFKVYGSGLADVDTQKPNMISANFVSSTDTHVKIAVEAEDDKGVTSYHVVDADHGIDEIYIAEAGQITILGLTAGTDYNFTITAKDLFGNESANSKTVAASTSSHLTAPATAATAPTWPADQVKAIYSPTYSADCNFADWGGCVAYTNDTYGKKFEMGAGCWGFGLNGYTLNCLSMEKLHVDIWIEDDASLRLVPIYGGAGLKTDDSHGKLVNLTGQQWNSIDLTLSSDFAGLDLSSIFQFKVDNANGLTIWIGNVYFYRESAIVDGQAPTNVSASVAARGFNSVKITAQAEDNSGAVSFKVLNGESILATGSAATGVSTTITISSLTPGTNYNLNVIAYDEAGNEASPVAVATSTKALPSPAPMPNFSNKNVVPVFTDAMAGGKTDIHSGGWGETTKVEWLDIAEGDKVFYVQNLNWAGWHSWGGGDIDATGMQYLHVDVYSLGATSVNVTPISHDPTHEGSSTIALTPNTWTSVDIPLSDYAANNIEWNKIFQFKFMNPVGGNELMIDNVYFWRNPTHTRNDSWMAPGELGTVCYPEGLIVTGATMYKMAGTDANGKFVFDEVDVLQPGVPYLFEAHANALHFYATAETPATEAGTSNGMVGTFSEKIISKDSPNIYYFSGQKFYAVTARQTDLTVPANRAYVDLTTPQPATAPKPGIRRITFDVEGTNTTTGVDQLNASDAPAKAIINGHLFILRGDKMYDATGRIVK